MPTNSCSVHSCRAASTQADNLRLRRRLSEGSLISFERELRGSEDGICAFARRGCRATGDAPRGAVDIPQRQIQNLGSPYERSWLAGNALPSVHGSTDASESLSLLAIVEDYIDSDEAMRELSGGELAMEGTVRKYCGATFMSFVSGGFLFPLCATRCRACISHPISLQFLPAAENECDEADERTQCACSVCNPLSGTVTGASTARAGGEPWGRMARGARAEMEPVLPVAGMEDVNRR